MFFLRGRPEREIRYRLAPGREPVQPVWFQFNASFELIQRNAQSQYFSYLTPAAALKWVVQQTLDLDLLNKGFWSLRPVFTHTENAGLLQGRYTRQSMEVTFYCLFVGDELNHARNLLICPHRPSDVHFSFIDWGVSFIMYKTFSFEHKQKVFSAVFDLQTAAWDPLLMSGLDYDIIDNRK